MTKTVYICGASDCCFDARFVGQSWHEHLSLQLSADYEIHNLAVPGASNFLIRLQIDRALESSAHAVIIHFTSSVRTEISLGQREDVRPLLDRFCRDDNSDATLLSLSRIQAKHNKLLNSVQQRLLEKYQLEFFDIDCAVQKNYYLIQGALAELAGQDKTRFCFSLGGFEHPDYMSQPQSKFRERLEKFKQWQSQENLWDYFTDWRVKQHNVTRPIPTGPLFHVNDPKSTTKIAEFYKNWLEAT